MRIIRLVSIIAFTFILCESKANGFLVDANGSIMYAGGNEVYFGYGFGFKGEINERIRTGGRIEHREAWIPFAEDDGSGYIIYVNSLTLLFEYDLKVGSFSPYVGAEIGRYKSGVGAAFGPNLGVAPCVGFNLDLTRRMTLDSNVKLHSFLDYDGTYFAMSLSTGIVVYLSKLE